MAGQKLYLEDDSIEVISTFARKSKLKVGVSKKRSFEAASEYARAGKKVCVLNFASATNPGGGVTHGSSAQEEDWYSVDIITCAAPNLRERPSNVMNPNAGTHAAKVTKDELLELLEKRIERIFAIAVQNGAEVLILGAFGCGAFCNPPEIVAKAFANIQEKYSGCFDAIEYAIYCRDYETANYDEFCNILSKR